VDTGGAASLLCCSDLAVAVAGTALETLLWLLLTTGGGDVDSGGEAMAAEAAERERSLTKRSVACFIAAIASAGLLKEEDDVEEEEEEGTGVDIVVVVVDVDVVVDGGVDVLVSDATSVAA
jgi:hypothetical protein